MIPLYGHRGDYALRSFRIYYRTYGLRIYIFFWVNIKCLLSIKINTLLPSKDARNSTRDNNNDDNTVKYVYASI